MYDNPVVNIYQSIEYLSNYLVALIVVEALILDCLESYFWAGQLCVHAR